MSVTLRLVSCTQRLSNGAIEPDSDVARVLELQNTVDKQVSPTQHTKHWQRLTTLYCTIYNMGSTSSKFVTSSWLYD
jgi:hypothetical protein